MNYFRDVLEKSLSLASLGKLRDALVSLDEGINNAIQNGQKKWIVRLSQNAGVMCEQLGEFDKAIQHYKISLKYDKENSYIHYSLANLYKKLGKKSSSWRYFNSCRRLAIRDNDSELLSIIELNKRNNK